MPVHTRDQLDPRLSHWHFVAYVMRHLRESHGLSLAQCGRVLGLERGTVSNFESGRRKLGDRYATLLDEHYGTGELLQTLVFYARMAHDPDWARTVSGYELEASWLKIFHGQTIPIPFQTEATIRAQLSAARSVRDVEATAQSRLARQDAILNRRDPPYLWLIIEEGTLEYATGGRSAQRAQLAHLLELSLRTHIGVRAIPKSTGSHIGTDGPIRLAEVAGRQIAYMGAQRGGRLIESPYEVAEVALDWEFMSQRALSDDDTRAMILRKMEALE
ncbi:helix-turn-helix transcriptional regulator [Actinocorallia longicatena]|uniref:Helix-turn-helix transcriptional regulator n=1 Tax=Actinocorallia longicatena TaxID=111803 RepID=A0ABP6QHU5_9ACTN